MDKQRMKLAVPELNYGKIGRYLNLDLLGQTDIARYIDPAILQRLNDEFLKADTGHDRGAIHIYGANHTDEVAAFYYSSIERLYKEGILVLRGEVPIKIKSITSSEKSSDNRYIDILFEDKKRLYLNGKGEFFKKGLGGVKLLSRHPRIMNAASLNLSGYDFTYFA